MLGAPADSTAATAEAATDSLDASQAADSLAAVVPLDSVAAAPAEPAEEPPPPPRSRIYMIEGDDLQHRRQGDLSITTLTNARLESDTLVITAKRAERQENPRRQRDEIFLYGDVHAEEGQTRIWGQEGHYDHMLDAATVSGEVRILDGETEIFCREAIYERQKQLILLAGDVEIHQEGDLISAQRIIYHRRTGFAEAFVDVSLWDTGSETVLRGQHGSYDREREIALMDEEPLLVKVEGRGDTIRVSSRTMRQLRGDSLAVAVGDVRYLRGRTEALCDSALYHMDEDRLLLYGEPKLLQGDSELTGEELELFFADGELIAMNIDGDARFQDEPADARVFPGLRSDIVGQRFHVSFEEGEIREVEVRGGPRSLYIPPVEEDGRAAMNDVSGDSMLLRFAGGELEEVRIFGSAQGSYSYLDGWREELSEADSLEAVLPPADAPADSASDADFESRAQTIIYKARDIIYESSKERVYLEGEAEVESADFVLMAKTIRFDARDDFLDARGEPVLIDNEDRLYGRLMEYDIDRRHGLVHEGATRYGEGYYTGERLKKVDDDLLHAQNSTYSSCELADPHYHFEFDRMTIRVRDKVVGGPVRFYLGEIPLFYLPFIFNNLQRGRRSGFLQPDFEFGITLKDDKPQRFVRDIGYYWALSEYAELLARGDFIEDRSLFGSFTYKYYRRYFLNGSIRSHLSYDVNRSLASDSFSWGLRGSHSQDIGERTKLTANVDFVSSESLRDIDNYTVEETINQRLNTNVGFTRKWDHVSLNTSYNRTQILNQEDEDPGTDNLLVDERTPVSISTTSIPLWPGGERQGGISGALAKLKLKPSVRYSRSRKTYETRRTVDESASTGSSLGFNWKLGFLNVRPSVSASENWSRSSVPLSVEQGVPFGKGENPIGGTPVSPDGETDALSTAEVEEAQDGQFSHQWSASASTSTRFYGIFYPRIGRLSGLRHTIVPSVSWQYSESRSKTFSLSRSLSFSLDNVLDLKFGKGEDVVRKTGILNWSMSTGLDLTKSGDEDPWRNLSSSVRLSPFPGFSMQMGHSFNLNTGEKISTTMSGNFSLSGGFAYGKVEKAEVDRNIVSEREEGIIAEESREEAEMDEWEEQDRPRQPRDGFDPLAPLSQGKRAGSGDTGGKQSWNLGASFSLNRTRSSSPSPSVAVGGSISLTENWHIDYRTNLRLEDGELGSQSLSVIRNLHCWEASFSRLVYQGQEQYYFRIYLRAHPEDIKIESGDRSAGFRGY